MSSKRSKTSSLTPGSIPSNTGGVIDRRIWKELRRRANGDRRSLALWQAYVQFLESCPTLPDQPRTAVHHILWRSEYSKYAKSSWNLIRLSNEDHAAAAALMLAAEPHNNKLQKGFNWTFKLIGRGSGWTTRDRQEIIRLYKEGWTSTRLGRRFGVSYGTILNLINKSGHKTRNNAEASALIAWSPKNPYETIRLYRSGWSQQRLAKKYGLKSEWAIARWLRSQGEHLRTISETAALKPCRFSTIQQKEITRLYLEGWSSNKIANRFHVSGHPILMFLKKKGLTKTSGDYRRWSPTVTEAEEAIQLYREGWSSEKIGRRYGRSGHCVLTFLKIRGIPIRSKGWTFKHSKATRRKMSVIAKRQWADPIGRRLKVIGLRSARRSRKAA